METQHKINRNDDSTEYLNITNFNNFVDKACPVEDLQASLRCLGQLADFEELNKEVQIENPKRIVYYHTFWSELNENETVDSVEMRVRKLNIASYLATQNLLHTKLLIWNLKPMKRKLSTHFKSIFQNYLDKGIIELRSLNLTGLCSYSSFSKIQKHVCATIDINKVKRNAFKDLIRFLLIFNYGGIFLDYDFIYSRINCKSQ